MSYRRIQNNLVAFIIKSWILVLSYQLTKGSLVNANFNDEKLKERNEIEPFKRGWCNQTNCDEGVFYSESDRNSHSCKYFKSSKRLICNGSLDYAYLKTVKDEQISDFIVENYEAESLYSRKYWSPDELNTGEWYLKLPKVYQKLTGKVRLVNTELQIEVNVRMLPKKDLKGFWIEGQAFSNRVIKISWGLKGNLSLDFVKNRTVISLNVNMLGESVWKLQSNFTFSRRNIENEEDEWGVNGIINSRYFSSNQLVLYKGTVWTKIRKEECKFLGDIKVQNVNLEASLSGNIAPPQKKQITIPKSAFSNMTIKNILFKDSHFYNDFHKDSFEGIRGLKSITFVDSKLEIFPRLNELLRGFSELEEIYIEDCTVPLLKFGVTANLKEVQRLSFKGSGPITFDGASFLWLQNSRLTFLSLRNSHVKISLKANSVLWSVNRTLKYLDISYSTLNGEREMNLILKNLNIVTLMAEGLNLNKIPTNALSNVRESLMHLSLRENDFRKNFEKHMFNTILSFPVMVNLKELNLEDCHMNYIEKGAFDNLPNLKTLLLGYNNLENVQDGWTHITPKIVRLDLSHNDVFPQSSIGLYQAGTSMNLSIFRNLETLDLSDGTFKEINKIVGGLGNGLRNLSLRNTKLQDLPDNFFQNLTDLEVLDLSHNRNMMAEQPLSFNLFKNLKKLRSLKLKYCRITSAAVYKNNLPQSGDFDEFTLENLEFLDLSVNNFKLLDHKILKVFPNLKILNLSGNSITEWSTTMFTNGHLESVFLDENKIETVTNEMLSDIGRLKHVKLGHNPFVCGSYVHEIIKMVKAAEKNESLHRHKESEKSEDQEADYLKIFLRKTTTNQESKNDNVKFLDWSESNYICYSWSQAKFMSFTQVNEDFHDSSQKKTDRIQTALLWWTGVVAAGAVISIAIICWKCLDIHLITRAVRSAVALSFLGRDETGLTNFKYKVFVSYSDKDRSWVIENLLPRLESSGEEQTVCLHERDFQVGLSIIDNILDSIESSRNIILVVSQAFLRSQWCQYEMQLAQFRLIEKGRHQLILIFLENIPPVKRPKTLRYLMMTKTYLEWPLNPKNHADVNTFWNRLMKSLENMN